MLTPNRRLKALSDGIRRLIDGQNVDLRDNREGALSILKNDIHTLASLKNEEVEALQAERTALRDTLADISHQLKTPLTSMLIMADLLETAPPNKQAEFIRHIRTGLVHTDWLVSALLKMAKLDAGAVDFAPDSALSGDILRLALTPLQVLLDVKGQKTAIAGEDLAVYCDRRWTAEALTNVIKNASEHSPEGGEITLQAGENPICAWFSVTDSGSGIPAADIPKLFQRFRSTGGDKGYGIGLALSLAIMRGQNGDIEVDGGAQGRGATFTLKMYK